MSDWHQWIGVLGMILIVGTYLLLQVGRISSTQLWFSILNAAGAMCLIVSLFFAFNLGALIVECFWAAISVLGIIRCLVGNAASEPCLTNSCTGPDGDTESESPARAR